MVYVSDVNRKSVVFVFASSHSNHLDFRLSLPGRIVEDGREKAKFDIDKGRSYHSVYD